MSSPHPRARVWTFGARPRFALTRIRHSRGGQQNHPTRRRFALPRPPYGSHVPGATCAPRKPPALRGVRTRLLGVLRVWTVASQRLRRFGKVRGARGACVAVRRRDPQFTTRIATRPRVSACAPESPSPSTRGRTRGSGVPQAWTAIRLRRVGRRGARCGSQGTSRPVDGPNKERSSRAAQVCARQHTPASRPLSLVGGLPLAAFTITAWARGAFKYVNAGMPFVS